MEAQHPDESIACQLDLGPARVFTALREQRAASKRNPCTLDEFLTTLEQERLVQTMARLRRHHCADLLWHMHHPHGNESHHHERIPVL
jgi:hypothetical protein